jgi:hypothetical protein
MASLLFDFSRPPTAKERIALAGRLRRIDADGFGEHLDTLTAKLTGYERPGGQLRRVGLRVRPQFSSRTSPIEGESSDRKAPPRPLRPPATRISSGGSSALRLELLAMALVQLHRKPGAKAHLYELGLPIAGSSSETGWADLVAAQPVDSTNRGLLITSRDKRARTVRSALTTLEEAGLVTVPGQRAQRNRFEEFALLNESGLEVIGERVEYTVPTKDEAQYLMPPGFVLNNWLHVLEDSEIAVLLMAACTGGAWLDDGMWAFPGEVRLRHYGIHRDPYSRARKTLEWLGLLDVREVGRHEDGRAEDDERLLHRIRLNVEAFEQPAHPTMRRVLGAQLARR